MEVAWQFAAIAVITAITAIARHGHDRIPTAPRRTPGEDSYSWPADARRDFYSRPADARRGSYSRPADVWRAPTAGLPTPSEIPTTEPNRTSAFLVAAE